MKVLARTWKGIDFDRMFSPERIELATINASKGKRGSYSVQKYLTNKGRRDTLRASVLDGGYDPIITPDRTVWDNRSCKWRTIRRPAFRDQIVHHALMLELEPYCMQYLVRHCIACIPGRGSEYGRKIVKSWTVKHKTESRWVLQCDVSHYYENVDSDILYSFFKSKIRDKRTLCLIGKIIATFTNGLVLGYYVCQWFGALYLASLDHAIKEKFKVKCYVRYVDNILVACRTKKKAREVLDFIREHLGGIGLAIKETGRECARIFRWANNFVDFIGFRTYRDGFQEIRKKTYLRIRRLVYRIRKNGCVSLGQARSLLSRRGIVLHSDCNIFFRSIEDMTASMGMRRMVGNANKQKG